MTLSIPQNDMPIGASSSVAAIEVHAESSSEPSFQYHGRDIAIVGTLECSTVTDDGNSTVAHPHVGTVDASHSFEKWTKKLERRFDDLAWKAASGELNGSQKAEFRRLTAARNRLLESRSIEEIRNDILRRRKIEELSSTLEKYVSKPFHPRQSQDKANLTRKSTRSSKA